jgi:N-acetyl-anhydromuramyl-L-alanine amidase AmpD
MFVEANSFRRSDRAVGDIRRIVIHTAEIQERRDSAEDVAGFFSNPSTSTSAHACIDNNSVVECVKDKDVAFHALGDNDATLGYELSGFAGQSKAEWDDAYSKQVVERTARYTAGKAHLYGIPARWLTAGQERARESGFVTHAIVSQVFGEGIRSDPGRFFPYDLFMERVKVHMAKLQKVQFVLSDTTKLAELARSLPAQVGAEEADRLRTFLSNQNARILRDLKQDGRVILDRVKA